MCPYFCDWWCVLLLHCVLLKAPHGSCRMCFERSLMLWVPFSSPFTVASPFFGALCWLPEDEEEEEAAAPDACCMASLSRNACCRVCTTSGMTASMSDSDSMGRPSKTVPSCRGGGGLADYTTGQCRQCKCVFPKFNIIQLFFVQQRNL